MENLRADKIIIEESKAKASAVVDANHDAYLDYQKIFDGEIDLAKAFTPQDVVSAWIQFKERTLREWNSFVKGAEAIDTSVIPPMILESWKRSREYRLDPFGETKNDILTGQALDRLFEDNRLLIDISQPFLNRLYQSMKTTSFSVTLSDSKGYILQIMQHEMHEGLHKLFKWFPGVLWSEESCGTNAIGTLLKHEKPFQIIGAQHYMQSFHFLTTSSAPIVDPEGKMIGGITILALLIAAHPHTLGMAIASAQAIENELGIRKALDRLQSAFHETDVAYSLQKAIITSIPEALIAVNTEGKITAINTRAQKLFGLEDRVVMGEPLDAVFSEENNRSFWNILHRQDSFSDREFRLLAAAGPGDFTLTCNSIYSSGGAAIGKVLIFSEIQRIKSLVNKYAGAKANLRFADIHGKNEKFRRIIDEAHVISKSASNVLLLGESGTGKDILAQAIHNASPRREGPYVAINCAAIPRDLIASELFGYAEGAFTGSRRGGSQGKFEMADGGTIFLDEIAEMPLEIQAVLLRVIEDKCVIRIGSNQIRTVDVRIVGATNKDLIEEVGRGSFRKDLYYRLNVFNIHLPPLRERKDDIPLLVDAFMKKCESALGKTISGVDEKVMDIFMHYSWPGNVRELQNVVERMVNYASSDRLTGNLVPPEIAGIDRAGRHHFDLESPEETEKNLIRHMLALKYSKARIAEELKVSRATLFRKMKKHGLNRRTAKQGGLRDTPFAGSSL